MTITHGELQGSREGTDSKARDGSGQLRYWVRGSNDIAAMETYVVAHALLPAQYVFGTRTMEYQTASWKQEAYKYWIYTGKYVEPDRADKEERLEVGSRKLSFDTTGQTARVYVSKATVGMYPRDPVPPLAPDVVGDYEGAIAVNQDDEPEGTDVVIPGLKATITARISRTSVNASYVKTLSRLTGTVNDAPFYGFDAEEWLFLGATGEIAGKTDPELQFHFLASENVTALAVGGISNIAKKGHEYIWIRFTDSTSGTPKVNVRIPIAAYVEQLYCLADWDDLLIGDSL